MRNEAEVPAVLAIPLFIIFWEGNRKKPWTWFARRLDWMFVRQKDVCRSPENHFMRQHLFPLNSD